MPAHEIFAALDGRFRIDRTLMVDPDTGKRHTAYNVELRPDRYASAWLHGLSRNHLVALHYALVVELSRQHVVQDAAAERARVKYNQRHGHP